MLKSNNFKYCAHIFTCYQSTKHFQPYTAWTLWLAHDSTICIWSIITIRTITNRLFDPLFDTEVNTKRIFGTALVHPICLT